MPLKDVIVRPVRFSEEAKAIARPIRHESHLLEAQMPAEVKLGGVWVPVWIDGVEHSQVTVRRTRPTQYS